MAVRQLQGSGEVVAAGEDVVLSDLGGHITLSLPLIGDGSAGTVLPGATVSVTSEAGGFILVLDNQGHKLGVVTPHSSELFGVLSEAGGWSKLPYPVARPASWPGGEGGGGEPGPQGEQGEQGETGAAGAAGAAGAQGIQGVPGNDGAAGAEGPQGDAGAAGDQGIQGIQGVPGDEGDQGIQGIQGIPGESDVPGPEGPQGDQGIQGIQGVEGPEGPQGEPGEGGGAAITFQEADRATDLALTTTYQAAVTLALVAGTYLVLGQTSIESTNATQSNVSVRLRDTTNSITYSIAEGEVDSALPDRCGLFVQALIVLAGAANIALEGRQSAGVSHMIGAGNLADAATKVTRLAAIKIA